MSIPVQAAIRVKQAEIQHLAHTSLHMVEAVVLAALPTQEALIAYPEAEVEADCSALAATVETLLPVLQVREVEEPVLLAEMVPVGTYQMYTAAVAAVHLHRLPTVRQIPAGLT